MTFRRKTSYELSYLLDKDMEVQYIFDKEDQNHNQTKI